MRTTYEIGAIHGGPFFLEIEIEARDEKGPRLSICGSTAQGGGQNRGDFAAITDFAPGWTPALRDQVLDIWNRYHLNDMRPYCEHQAEWKTDHKIEFITYSIEWDDRRQIERQADHDAAALGHPAAQRQDFVRYSHAADLLRVLNIAKIQPHTWTAIKDGKILAQLDRLFSIVPEHDAKKYRDNATRIVTETRQGLRVLGVRQSERGQLRAPVLKRTETKTAGWVRPTEHPDGLLCKPCAVCGYEYGSRWLFTPIPADVLATLAGLPKSSDADQNPYDVIADRFLKKYRISFTPTHARTKASGTMTTAQHWRIEFKDAHGHTLSFDFWNSQHDTEKRIPLRAYSVLACLSLDSTYDDIDECARDTGSSPSVARAAVTFAKRIRRFFDHSDALDALREIS